jgi:hypothetical protein
MILVKWFLIESETLVDESESRKETKKKGEDTMDARMLKVKLQLMTQDFSALTIEKKKQVLYII